MLRFLFTRRWLGLFTLVVCVAVGCVLLSQWQWHRREQRLATNALVATNYGKAPIALNDAIGDGRLPTTATWTPVELAGQYLAAETVLVRNRPLNGTSGYYVLVPFRQGDGRTLFVNRGWIPTGATGEAPDSVPAPPAGDVTIVARLLPPEPTSSQVAPAGQAYRITPAALAQSNELTGSVVTGAFGLLATESPAAATAPTPLPEPELDEGPHLSYSVQWIMFGVGAFVGFYFLVRRALEDERAERDELAGNPGPAAPRERKRLTDAEEEDAILDAAQHRK